jgi:L-ribulose-5-phosphate 4-epimerase
MKFAALREEVCQANKDIVKAGLVVLTWGNASGVDRDAGVMAIKPSGVDYDALRPQDIVIVDLESGRTVDGKLRPSSDTPTHRCLYLNFPSAGGIVHTHSTHATSWAQAGKDLPCFGTTHADHFYGPVPVARPLSRQEIAGEYEWNTGLSIVDRFKRSKIDAAMMPAVLVPGHAPFTWGATVAKALENAVALEAAARMALLTREVAPGARPLPRALLDRHFLRKHGAKAYYGQH